MNAIESDVLVEAISIERRKDVFVLHYKLTKEKWDNTFYFTQKEFEHLARNEDFWPFYADGYNLCQFTGSHLRFGRLDGERKELWLPFRNKELIPELKNALNMEVGTEKDLLNAFFYSRDKAIPSVHETIDEKALPITQLEGIEPYLERVRNIAKNSSKGVDDPVELNFYADGYRSLYFTITPGRGMRNGGINWHESSNEWSINT